MIETVQHLLGACGDNHSHFDLTDLALMGGGAMGLHSLRYYVIGMYVLSKSYVKEKYNALKVW
jgi:hypothetical protein